MRSVIGQRRGQRRDESGAVLILVAFSLTALIAAAALTVDIGQIVSQRRALQAGADLVALDAARYLSGAPANLVYGNVCAAAKESASRNGYISFDCTTQMFLGQYTSSLPFSPIINPTTSTAVPNAVQIQMPASVSFVFQPGSASTSRTATAGVPGVNLSGGSLGFTIGSFLVGWNTSNSIAGHVLDALLGTNSRGRLVGYQGLASTSVTVQDLATASAGAGAFTPDQVFTGAVTLQQVMTAEETVMSSKANSAAAADLQAVQVGMGSFGTTTIGKPILSLGTSTGYSSVAAAEGAASVNLLELLNATAQLANGSTAIDLSLVTPLLSAKISVINPPAYVPPAPVNVATGSTAQVSVTLTLAGLPIVLSGVNATGTLTALDCSQNSSTISVTTSALQAAGITLPGGGTAPVTFSGPYDGTVTRTVSPSPVNSATIPVIGSLGPAILDPLLSALGLAVLGADVTPIGLSCPVAGSLATAPPVLIQ